MSDQNTGQIDNVLHEDRLFPPPAKFSAGAAIASMDDYQKLYDAAKEDPEKFWGDIAKAEMHWFKPFDSVVKQNGKDVTWFEGGQTNISYNCLDAHIEVGNGDRAAIIWEGEPGDQLTLTYSTTANRSSPSAPMHSSRSASGVERRRKRCTCQ